MKQFSLTILMLLGLLTAVCGLGSCTDDLGMKSDLSPVPDGERIVLGFAPYGMEKSATRAIEDTEFESAVEKLDVFVFDADGNRRHYERVTFSETYPNEGTLVLNKWRSEFTQDANYTIHLVANAADSFNPQSINTFIDLQNATEQYDNIHLTAVGDYQRHFVMYGKSAEVVLNPGGNKNTTVDIPLVREAAKIVLTLTEGLKNGSDSDYFTFSTQIATQFRFSNLQTEARYVYDADDLPDNPLINTELTPSCVEGPSTGDAPHSITVTTYAYPNSWENERAKITHLVVQLPYMKDDGVTEVNNFYSIPITNQTALEANHVYTINATIDAAGSTTDYKPKEIKGTYSVTEWIPEEIEIGGESNPHYLTFDKEYLVMRGIESDSIGFASSHNLEITLDDAYFYNKYGVKTSIKNNGDNTFNIKVNSSATNDEDDSKLISEVVTWKDFHGNYIHIDCPMPKNNLPHYITFTVRHKDCSEGENCKLSATITIEQYPTEYITSYFGWHSYRDDFISATNPYPMTSGFSLDACNITNIQNKSNETAVVRLYKGPDDPTQNAPLVWSYRIKRATGTNNSGPGFFKSKVAKQPEEEGNNSYFTWSNSWVENTITGFNVDKISISQFGFRDDVFSLPEGETNNPRIYQINITSTKKPTYQIIASNGSQPEPMDYDVTQPRLDALGYTSSSPDNLRLVSPAFAISSRLGAVSSKETVLKEYQDGTTPNPPLGDNIKNVEIFYLDPSEATKTESYETAAEHCARYVEVYKQRNKDGDLTGDPDIVLDKWRLPTPAELRILIYYQSEGISEDEIQPDAMDYQLPACRFWTADPNGPIYNWNYKKYDKNGNVVEYNENDVGLRCVHDMTDILTNGN